MSVDNCGKPSFVHLAQTESNGPPVTLSWGPGTAGAENPITGYRVWRVELLEDGKTPSSSLLENVCDYASDVFSAQVPPPVTIGYYYQYLVETRGSFGDMFCSELKHADNLLKKLKPPLESYTDPVLTAGQTRIKAVHMLELQENINVLRMAHGKDDYTFTTIQAGYTSLAGWTSHVAEMRAAIDEITTEHEAWIAITENRPTAAVIEQLRRVVDTLP